MYVGRSNDDETSFLIAVAWFGGFAVLNTEQWGAYNLILTMW